MIGNLLAYSLLASTLLTVVWVVYKSLLAETLYFRINRILLLFCVAFSFILPVFIITPRFVVDIAANHTDVVLDPIETFYIANTVSEKLHQYGIILRRYILLEALPCSYIFLYRCQDLLFSS